MSNQQMRLVLNKAKKAKMRAGAARRLVPESMCLQHHPAHLEHSRHAETGFQRGALGEHC